MRTLSSRGCAPAVLGDPLCRLLTLKMVQERISMSHCVNRSIKDEVAGRQAGFSSTGSEAALAKCRAPASDATSEYIAAAAAKKRHCWQQTYLNSDMVALGCEHCTAPSVPFSVDWLTSAVQVATLTAAALLRHFQRKQSTRDCFLCCCHKAANYSSIISANGK